MTRTKDSTRHACRPLPPESRLMVVRSRFIRLRYLSAYKKCALYPNCKNCQKVCVPFGSFGSTPLDTFHRFWIDM